jgi:hypothetical protein
VRLRVKGSQLQEGVGDFLLFLQVGHGYLHTMLECEILNKGAVAIGEGGILPFAIAGGAQVLSAVGVRDH